MSDQDKAVEHLLDLGEQRMAELLASSIVETFGDWLEREEGRGPKGKIIEDVCIFFGFLCGMATKSLGLLEVNDPLEEDLKVFLTERFLEGYRRGTV